MNGKKLWEIPFGQRKINNSTIIDGDQNFGGVISTKAKIIFANGNPDSKAYAFNLEEGKYGKQIFLILGLHPNGL